VAAGVTYAGDEGQRLMQVSATRQIPISDSGNDVFMRIRNGNGTFSTAVTATNAGSAIIDAGAVLNPASWSAGNIPATGLKIVFSVVGTTTTYDIQDAATSTSLLTAPLAYVPGQAIPLVKTTAPAADYGAQVVISGQPANGDSFAIQPSSSQSLFTTLANLITALETPISASSGNTLLANRIGAALTNLDQASDNILRIRASVGARLNELDSLGKAGEDIGLQYQQSLSSLQDVDYAAAITQLTQQQSYLEAAQKSFMKVSDLSLFNFV
jgi:flagellar hook-associated protein 3 FlgL